MTMSNQERDNSVIHPWWVRTWHWSNAIAVIVMTMSGWQIYDASPLFPSIRFPNVVTLGGWLGGALMWHFAAMWLLVASFCFYVIPGLITGRFFNKLLPISPHAVARDLFAALKGRLSHEDLGSYNAVQKLAYVIVLADLCVVIASGLSIWKSVQFPWLRELLGGYDSARHVHFVAMGVLVGFFTVHVSLVALVPRALLTMLRGR